LCGMLPFVRSDLSVERAIQRIAWATLDDCPPIGVPAPSLKEENGALDQPEPRARQALGDVPMYATHERSHVTRVVRECCGPAGAQYR